MSYGIKVWDGAGNVLLDTDTLSFRYVAGYPFTPSASTDQTINVPGITAATHFATMTSSDGFLSVENNLIRIRRAISTSGSPTTVHLYRL